MATWQAEVFVNSRVGRIKTEVEAATFSGAKEQIYAKHGNVQQIVNLRQVSNRSSSGGSEASLDGTVALIGLIAAAWAFMSFTPWILMGLGGAAGAWIGEKVTNQSVEEYADNGSDTDAGHIKAAITLALALILGGVGFVQGDSLKKGFDAPDAPAQVQPKN
jgi:hypothetical protein